MGSAYSDGLEHGTPEAVDDYYAEPTLNATHMAEVDWLDDERIIVRSLVDTYLQRWPEPQEREVRFEFEDGDNGYIDGVLDSNTLVENKCKSRFAPQDAAALALDSQCTGYISAWNRLTDTPVEEIVLYYDVALKPMIRQKKGETKIDYKARLAEVIYSDPAKYHQRHEVTRSQRQVDEYRQNVAEAKLLLDHLEQRGVWAMNTTACSLYGKCDFFDVCVAKPADRSKVIADKYTEKESR